nr:hypothetical protein [Tanacetum cinerariifolium]
MNVTGARENVGSPVVQQSGIQCFNCKEFDMDEEIDEQELEAHYNYMAKIQEVPTADTCTDSEPLEKNDQNEVESDDERVALANLFANLKLDVDENKMLSMEKQLKLIPDGEETLALERESRSKLYKDSIMCSYPFHRFINMSNINNNMQTQTSNSLHNAIMEAGSKDRPPMLAPGNYIQWKSRIKRYIDTKPNREHIHYCLENPPYELGWKDQFINDAEGNPTTATHQCQPMNQDSYNSNSLGFDQPQPPQSPVIHQPPKELSIQEMEDLKQQYLDELKRLSNLEYRDEIKIAELTENFNDEFIKSSVEDLIPIPSKSEGIHEHVCDVPSHDNSPPLDISKDQFEDLSESNEEFSLTGDDSFSFDKIDYVKASPPDSELVSSELCSDEDVLEKIILKPLFEEEIIPMKSLRTHDSSLPISSKIDSLLEEFAEEFVSANSDAAIESFSPSPILVKDIDSLMEEIDLTCTPDYPMPPGIVDEDYDSERDILIRKDLPSNNTLSFAEK